MNDLIHCSVAAGSDHDFLTARRQFEGDPFRITASLCQMHPGSRLKSADTLLERACT